MPVKNMKPSRDVREHYLNAKLLLLLTSSAGVGEVKKAIEDGADVNYRCVELGNNTPLHLAVGENRLDVVKCLCRMGANPRFKNDIGLSPLDIANELGFQRVLNFLENWKGNVASTLPTRARVTNGTAADTTEPGDHPENPTRPESKPFNVSYYISRTLACEMAIQKDIFVKFQKKKNDNDVKFFVSQDGDDVLTKSKDDFKMLCKEYPASNVHWLICHKSGTVVWHRSRGSLRNLLKFIDVNNPKLYTPEKMDNLIDMASWRKFVLIVDNPGMGKSVFLAYMSNIIKRKYPLMWVSRVDLYDCCEYFDDYTCGALSIRELCESVFGIKTALERSVFWRLLEKGEAVLMLDAVDEVNPRYKKAVDDLLMFLKGQHTHQLWVTVRPYLKNELIALLGQMPFYLMPFTQDNQKHFFTSFFRMKTLKNWKTVDEPRLHKFVHALIELMIRSIGESTRDFLRTPLHARMMGEAFEDELKNYMQTQDEDLNLPTVINLIDLYQSLLGRKFSIFTKKSGYVEYSYQYYLHKVNIVRNHQLLALDDLYPKLIFEIFSKKPIHFLDYEYLEKYGVVTFHSDVAFFLHKSFVDFLVADFLGDEIAKQRDHNRIKQLMMGGLLVEEKHSLLRSFLNYLIPRIVLSEITLKQIGDWTIDIWTKGGAWRVTLIYAQVQEGNTSILNMILDALKYCDRTDIIGEVLCSKATANNKTTNVWHLTASRGHRDTFQCLWDWAKAMKINLKNVMTKTNIEQMTLWHAASLNGHVCVIELLLMLLRNDNINLDRSFLLEQNAVGDTAWHTSVRSENTALIKILWNYAKEAKLDFAKTMFIVNRKGYNMFHLAANSESTDILMTIWNLLDTADMKKTMLNRRTLNDESVLHVASRNSNTDCLVFLLDAFNELGFDMKSILSDKDCDDETIWHICTYSSQNAEALLVLGEWARECGLSITNVLFMKNKEGQTLLHLAANKILHLKVIWNWAEIEKVDFKKFLSTRDVYGRTVFLTACSDGNHECLNIIYRWALKKSINVCKMLTEKDNKGDGAWHLASAHSRVTNCLWRWTRQHGLDIGKTFEQKNKTNESVWHYVAAHNIKNFKKYYAWTAGTDVDVRAILEDPFMWLSVVVSNKTGVLEQFREMCKREGVDMRKILATRSGNGYTLWLYACDAGGSKSIETVWKWIKEYKLSPREFVRQKADSGNNIWHLQFRLNQSSNVEILWKLTKEAEVDPETMLAETNDEGLTAWNIAETYSPRALAIINRLTGKIVDSNEFQLHTDPILMAPNASSDSFDDKK